VIVRRALATRNVASAGGSGYRKRPRMVCRHFERRRASRLNALELASDATGGDREISLADSAKRSSDAAFSTTAPATALRHDQRLHQERARVGSGRVALRLMRMIDAGEDPMFIGAAS